MTTQAIFRKIAKESGVTVAQVKKDMQSALDEAYQNPNMDAITKAYQDQIPRKGKIPTVEEFIKYTSQKIMSTEKSPLDLPPF